MFKALFSSRAVAALAIITLAIVGYLWWQETEEQFPRLLAGSYLGVIQGALGNEEVPFYVEQASQANQALVLVLREGYQPQVVTFLSSDPNDGASGFYPISIIGSKEQLRLSGKAVSDVSYNGQVTDQVNHRSGTWRLGRIPEQASTQTAMNNDAIRLWLLLRSELKGVEEEIQRVKQDNQTKVTDYKRLAEFIKEGLTLKQRGEEKFNQVQSDLLTVRKTLAQKQEEARNLEDKINLSQKVTSSGRLASLSRETFERENRWIDNALSKAPAASVLEPPPVGTDSKPAPSTNGDINSQYE